MITFLIVFVGLAAALVLFCCATRREGLSFGAGMTGACGTGYAIIAIFAVICLSSAMPYETVSEESVPFTDSVVETTDASVTVRMPDGSEKNMRYEPMTIEYSPDIERAIFVVMEQKCDLIALHRCECKLVIPDGEIPPGVLVEDEDYERTAVFAVLDAERADDAQ